MVSFTPWDRGPGIYLTGGWARWGPKLEVLEWKHLFPLSVFESRIVQPAAYSLYRHPVSKYLNYLVSEVMAHCTVQEHVMLLEMTERC